MTSGPVTMDELVALIERFDPLRAASVPAAVFASTAGFDRLRDLLGGHGWRSELRAVGPVVRSGVEIPIFLDDDLEPGVIEFRDQAGAVLERVTLPAVGA